MHLESIMFYIICVHLELNCCLDQVAKTYKGMVGGTGR